MQAEASPENKDAILFEINPKQEYHLIATKNTFYCLWNLLLSRRFEKTELWFYSPQHPPSHLSSPTILNPDFGVVIGPDMDKISDRQRKAWLARSKTWHDLQPASDWKARKVLGPGTFWSHRAFRIHRQRSCQA